jgi:xanthine dehydrogenase accessory factor
MLAFLAAITGGERTGLAVHGPAPGALLAVDDGGRHGSLRAGPRLDTNVERESRGLIAQGRTALRRFGTDGETLGTDLGVHITFTATPPTMIVVGPGDYGAALAAAARSVGYAVTICDPRPAFVTSPRVAANATVSREWPQDLLGAQRLGPRDAVVIVTHDAKLDVPALERALAAETDYVGALGSRDAAHDRLERLPAAGVAEHELARIHSPCGLDIGPASAEETAIAIVAEIVARRNGRTGGHLLDGAGPVRGHGIS